MSRVKGSRHAEEAAGLLHERKSPPVHFPGRNGEGVSPFDQALSALI